MTKWLSQKASPTAARAGEPTEPLPAKAGQEQSAHCRSAGRASDCETASLGVLLLWADANQQPEVIRRRLLWHLRRPVATRLPSL